MRRSFLLAALVGILAGVPAAAPAYHRSPYYVHQTYVIGYDDNVNIRTQHAPPSAVRANGGPLTAKQLEALRDHPKPGELKMFGYAAQKSDLELADFATLYLEKEVPDFGGKTRWVQRTPIYCQIHHNRPSQNMLVVYSPYVGSGASPIPYLIGKDRFPTGSQYRNGISLPHVRLKTILIHSYYTPPPHR